jgi:hypothetical protein
MTPAVRRVGALFVTVSAMLLAVLASAVVTVSHATTTAAPSRCGNATRIVRVPVGGDGASLASLSGPSTNQYAGGATASTNRGSNVPQNTVPILVHSTGGAFTAVTGLQISPSYGGVQTVRVFAPASVWAGGYELYSDRPSEPASFMRARLWHLGTGGWHQVNLPARPAAVMGIAGSADAPIIVGQDHSPNFFATFILGGSIWAYRGNADGSSWTPLTLPAFNGADISSVKTLGTTTFVGGLWQGADGNFHDLLLRIAADGTVTQLPVADARRQPNDLNGIVSVAPFSASSILIVAHASGDYSGYSSKIGVFTFPRRTVYFPQPQLITGDWGGRGPAGADTGAVASAALPRGVAVVSDPTGIFIVQTLGARLVQLAYVPDTSFRTHDISATGTVRRKRVAGKTVSEMVVTARLAGYDNRGPSNRASVARLSCTVALK